MKIDLETMEAIQGALLEVPLVVDSMADPGGSMGALVSWLKRLETLLSSKRLRMAASVASLRGVLIAAERGRVHKEVEILGRPSRSRVVLATASFVVERVVGEVSAALAPHEARYAEAETLARQLVAAAKVRGVGPRHGRPRAHAVTGWVASASADRELAGGFANLASMVGSKDATELLTRCFE